MIRRSLENQNWAYVRINILKFYIFCFYCFPSGRLSKVIETKLHTTWFYVISVVIRPRFNVMARRHSTLKRRRVSLGCKTFIKNKKRSGTSLPASFCLWFLILYENISAFIFYYLTKFQCLVAFTSWDIRKYVYCNCLLTTLWRQKFWN